MKILKTEIEDLILLEPEVHGDERGYFVETFSQRDFDRQVSIPLYGKSIIFVQDNESKSRRGVLRGLHFQRPPYAQAKIVACVQGRILDFAVDMRVGSPTWGKHFSVELSGDNHRQLFIPKGFAHGYLTLSDTAVCRYKCDEFYHPESEGGISLLDPALELEIPEGQYIMSAKDKTWGNLGEAGTIFTYQNK
ncbi:MAG: dTDP-4-dehydrorhamnose 3,5-epimerase [Candidatus Cryptobacteroides sp.]